MLAYVYTYRPCERLLRQPELAPLSNAFQALLLDISLVGIIGITAGHQLSLGHHVDSLDVPSQRETMLDTLEELHLESVLTLLQNIDCSISVLVRKGMIDLGAR